MPRAEPKSDSNRAEQNEKITFSAALGHPFACFTVSEALEVEASVIKAFNHSYSSKGKGISHIVSENAAVRVVFDTCQRAPISTLARKDKVLDSSFVLSHSKMESAYG